MSWAHLRGHDGPCADLRQAWVSDRLGHAYLFAGPHGIGKHTFARELAKALLCEATDRADAFVACDRCVACRLVDANAHPDLTLAGPGPDDRELKIGPMRAFCATLELKPARGIRKVAILDEVDLLNDEAANCFLKTLEEPAPGALLLLVGTSPDLQLPTIVSRCQVLRFQPLSVPVLRELLAAYGIAPALHDRLVQLAGGSIGQALLLSDPELWDFRRTVLETLTATRPDVVELAAKWNEFASAGEVPRKRAAGVLHLVLELFHGVLLLAAGGPVTGMAPEERSAFEAVARRYVPDRLLQLVERCLEAEWQLDRGMQIALVLEALTDTFAEVQPSA